MPNSLPLVPTPNPFSTVTVNGFFTKDLVANYSQKFATTVVTQGSAVTVSVDATNVPAVYYLYGVSATASKSLAGFIHVIGSGQVAVTNAQNIGTAASTTADTVVISMATNVITITNAGTNNATETKDLYLFRIL
jgi:hypothetical protein